MKYLAQYAASQRTSAFVLSQTAIGDLKPILGQPGQVYTLMPRTPEMMLSSAYDLLQVIKEMVLQRRSGMGVLAADYADRPRPIDPR